MKVDESKVLCMEFYQSKKEDNPDKLNVSKHAWIIAVDKHEN